MLIWKGPSPNSKHIENENTRIWQVESKATVFIAEQSAGETVSVCKYVHMV